MKVTLDLPDIKGYEYTGEYRNTESGEWFCNFKKQAECAQGGPGQIGPYPILKKIAPKYKTHCLTDANLKYVEIKALEDALNLYEGAALSNGQGKKRDKLRALINQPKENKNV